MISKFQLSELEVLRDTTEEYVKAECAHSM